jgi:hypothetical protein
MNKPRLLDLFCGLGLNTTKTMRGWGYDVKPDVICPKPKTNDDYLKAFDKMHEVMRLKNGI